MHTTPDQSSIWNGHAGHTWAALQNPLDQLFEPMLQHLLTQCPPLPASAQVLDVGCGTGALTLALQHRLGGSTACSGVDISEPMLTLAQQRAQQATSRAQFMLVDAAQHPFQARQFDLIASRFGVMFFPDPVGAFRNLHRATQPGGHLLALAWRAPSLNAFMTRAEQIAGPLLPELVLRPAGGPGQFSFADADKVLDILQASGWQQGQLTPVDLVCRIPKADLHRYITSMGPVGAIYKALPADRQATLTDALQQGFAEFVGTDGVAQFTAACWQINARA